MAGQNKNNSISENESDLVKSMRPLGLDALAISLERVTNGNYRDIFECWLLSYLVIGEPIPNKHKLLLGWVLVGRFDPTVPTIIPSSLLEAIRSWSDDFADGKLAHVHKLIMEVHK